MTPRERAQQRQRDRVATCRHRCPCGLKDAKDCDCQREDDFVLTPWGDFVHDETVPLDGETDT